MRQKRRSKQLIDSDLGKQLAKSDDLGRARRIDGVQDRYIEFAKLTLPKAVSFEGLRVVIDCANGAAYRVAPGALWEMGADVISIGVDPDGFNINKDCGSTDLRALCAKVREMRADIGIALDGDADRVMIVDERGHVVDGDQLLAVIAESWKQDNRLQRPGVVATVMSNLGLERSSRRSWSSSWYALRSATVTCSNTCGRTAYNIGGEPSGHIILSDYTTTGDGFIAALQVLCRDQARRQAGVGAVPSLRAVAAGAEERAVSERQAARKCARCARRSQAPNASLAEAVA